MTSTACYAPSIGTLRAAVDDLDRIGFQFEMSLDNVVELTPQ
jgi:hypothetical protein